MKVDEHIAKAISDYLAEKRMLARDLCEAFSVSEGTLSNWRRVGRGINDENWGPLFSIIKPYLPASRIYIDSAGAEQYQSAFVVPDNQKSSVKINRNFAVQTVPKFTIQQISKFNFLLDSIEQLAQNEQAPRIDYHTKTPGCGIGIFAIKTKSETAVPAGAVVFASTDLKPRDGGIVLYLSLEGRVDIARFSVKGVFFELSGKEKIFGETEKILDHVKWIFPIVHYYVVTY